MLERLACHYDEQSVAAGTSSSGVGVYLKVTATKMAAATAASTMAVEMIRVALALLPAAETNWAASLPNKCGGACAKRSCRFCARKVVLGCADAWPLHVRRPHA